MGDLPAWFLAAPLPTDEEMRHARRVGEQRRAQAVRKLQHALWQVFTARRTKDLLPGVVLLWGGDRRVASTDRGGLLASMARAILASLRLLVLLRSLASIDEPQTPTATAEARGPAPLRGPPALVGMRDAA